MSNQKYPPDLAFIPAPSATKQKDNKSKEPKKEQPAGTSSDKSKQKSEKEMFFLKNRMKDVKNVTEKTQDLDKILDEVKAMEEICSSLKCKVKIRDFAITCEYCKGRFCTQHYLPEVHGCGDAVRKDYKQKFVHPGPEKLAPKKKDQAHTKLSMKLKQMQDSRKKTNTANTKKSEETKTKKK